MTPDTLLFHLRVVGVLLAVLVVVNLFVPAHLRWREELARLSLVNRQIVQVHSAFIVLVLGLMAALLLTAGSALLERTPLSRAVLAGLAIFWTVRMLAQWFFYSPEVWRGDRLRTTVHWLFSGVWVYATLVFALALRSVL
jgi:hypothetical protein